MRWATFDAAWHSGPGLGIFLDAHTLSVPARDGLITGRLLFRLNNLHHLRNYARVMPHYERAV